MYISPNLSVALVGKDTSEWYINGLVSEGTKKFSRPRIALNRSARDSGEANRQPNNRYNGRAVPDVIAHTDRPFVLYGLLQFTQAGVEQEVESDGRSLA